VPADGEGLPGGTDWNGEGTAIGKDQADLEPGDVVFFGGSDLWHYAHSGIYAGGGEVWDALQTGTPVEEHTVAALTADYGGTYQGAVRYTGTVTDTPPVITTQPKRQKVASGAMATFTAAASGTPTPTVQWESKAKAKGSAWTDVTGGTSDTLSFTATTAETGSTYEAVFANSAGTKTTKKVKLTVT
jgi:hypothetical protein